MAPLVRVREIVRVRVRVRGRVGIRVGVGVGARVEGAVGTVVRGPYEVGVPREVQLEPLGR